MPDRCTAATATTTAPTATAAAAPITIAVSARWARSTRPGSPSVTVADGGASPATVRVFNATLPWLDGYGIVFFAVPSLQAAIDGMVEAQAFDVAMDGQSVVEVAWTGGLGARDQLSACISARR